MRRLLLLSLCACATGGADTDTGEDTEDTEGTGDTEETASPKVDTGLALVYFEGAAALSAAGWDGREEWVATSVDGTIEHCRVASALTGFPAEVELCPGCSFAFQVTVGSGTATGDGCDNMRFTADMWEGASWLYAFAPTYAYGPHTYENVLLHGYVADDEVRWSLTALAETYEDTAIDYEALSSDLWTYFSD